MLKSAPSGREELNRRHARALSVSFERPWSPTWTSPQLTTSAFLDSSSLCHALCECHNNGRCRHERRHPFLELVPRSAHLPSQWHTSSKSLPWKGSYDHTVDSFSQSPMLLTTRCRSKLRKARRTKHENKESTWLMMAWTPKRLFLSLCISISLLRSYTFFSRSPLVFKTLFENACEL